MEQDSITIGSKTPFHKQLKTDARNMEPNKIAIQQMHYALAQAGIQQVFSCLAWPGSPGTDPQYSASQNARRRAREWSLKLLLGCPCSRTVWSFKLRRKPAFIVRVSQADHCVRQCDFEGLGPLYTKLRKSRGKCPLEKVEMGFELHSGCPARLAGWHSG